MTPDQLNFFKANGYLMLHDALTSEEVDRFRTLYDRDRSDIRYFWRLIGPNGNQTVNCDPLISSPEFDDLVRHPRLLTCVEELLGEPACLSEVCLRHMEPYRGAPKQSWHRDRQHTLTHPFRAGFIHVLIYFSDVDESTHCFSISPESIDDPILDTEAQLARSGSVDIHGPAGTAVLFNLSVLHTATVRPTTQERKTIQTYYGMQSGPILSHYSTIPARLWRDHPDPGVRAFYGKLNDKSIRFAEAYGVKSSDE